jgi:hypothetical protein
MTDEPVNTGENRKPGTFTKNDPRINRKGRPRSFDAWRALAVELVGEPALKADDKLILIKIPKLLDGKPVVDEQGNPVMIDHYATNAEMIARSWLKDAKRQQSLIEAAFGKVPDELKQSGSINLNVIYKEKPAKAEDDGGSQ